jgi:hypothetical protein
LRPSKLKFALLTVALVLSNVWWAYKLFDAGITQTYLGQSLLDNREALAQAIHLLPAVARPGTGQPEIVAIARRHSSGGEPFEKDGFVWVGKIGLKFNERGQLIEAARGWDPP